MNNEWKYELNEQTGEHTVYPPSTIQFDAFIDAYDFWDTYRLEIKESPFEYQCAIYQTTVENTVRCVFDPHEGYYDAEDYYRKNRKEIENKSFYFKGSKYRMMLKGNGKREREEVVCIFHAAAKQYIRVKGDFYKWVEQVQPNGKVLRVLDAWDDKAINIDFEHIKGFKQMIKSYESFCVMPDHFNYQREIAKSFNRYHRVTHIPKEGEFPNTLQYFKHIFGEQLEMGLDYFKVLWEQPTHKLPILTLVAPENGTGKSTLLFYAQALFQDNCSLVGNSEIANDFNGTYLDKVMVGLDEATIEKKVVFERMKSQNTAPTVWLNEKGVKQKKINCHLHFMIATNNANDFAKIDGHDSRFWVRRVSPPKERNPDLLASMVAEIPAFLHFLVNREFHIQREDRFWFKPERFFTEAKGKVISASLPKNVKVLKEFFDIYFEMTKREHIYMIKSDLNEILKREGGTGTFDADFLANYIKFEKMVKVSSQERSFPYSIETTNKENQRYIHFWAGNYLSKEMFEELFKSNESEQQQETKTIAPYPEPLEDNAPF